MDGDTVADNCPICFDIFRLPKILPCGHTFCFQCLKEYSDEKLDNNGIVCPLCRSNNKILNTGLSGFVTNYFVQSSKPEKICFNCKLSEISTCCTICFSYLCSKCYKAHVHPVVNSSSLSDSEDEELPAIRSLHLGLMLQNIRTKYICRVESQFVVETPQDEIGRHILYSIFPMKSGDVLIMPSGLPHILQLDPQGNVKKRIRCHFQCTDIIELDDGSLLGTFGFNGLILKYMLEGWTNFTTCPEYLPLSITLLSNGNIAACGVEKTQLTHGSYSKNRGNIQVYSPEGKSMKGLHKSFEKENILSVPFKMSACKQHKTIAVVDQENRLVLILQEDLVPLKVYRGNNEMLPIPFPELGIPNQGRFQPLGICCSVNGFFFASSSDGYLHVLDHSGTFLGLALTDCEDGFGRMADVRQDRNGTIWCSDSQNGMVRTFKIIRFQNNFSECDHGLRHGLG